MRNVAMINYYQRFGVEVRVLIDIENDCLFDKERIKWEIKNFLEDSPKLNDILQFVDTVYALGYYLADFRLNLFTRTEIENLPLGISKEEREKLREPIMYSKYDEAKALVDKYQEYKANGRQKSKK